MAKAIDAHETAAAAKNKRAMGRTEDYGDCTDI
jgi:hypothetical protein